MVYRKGQKKKKNQLLPKCYFFKGLLTGTVKIIDHIYNYV